MRPRARRTAIAAALAVASGGLVALGPASPASAAPPSARSFYITDYNADWAYARGCDLGEADRSTSGTQKHVTVLDFGAMYQNSAGTWMVTAFGGTDFSIAYARDMVVHYAEGYYVCTGGDTTSTVYIGLGTNNSGGDITSAAGARMATAAQTAVKAVTNAGQYGQARPIAANDFESWGAGSSRATASRNWISGYNGADSRPMVVDYGSADGCPTASVPTASSCNAGLPAETIWQVAWSGVAWPLPEIYTTSGTQAKQWRYLSKYSRNQHGSAFVFQGVMSQAGACSQVSGGCPGADNGPADAWSQLNTQVNNDPATATTPGPPTNVWHQ